MVHKDTGSIRGQASCDWETLYVNPAVNEYVFLNQEGKDSERRRIGFIFICCAQDTVAALQPPLLLQPLGYGKPFLIFYIMAQHSIEWYEALMLFPIPSVLSQP